MCYKEPILHVDSLIQVGNQTFGIAVKYIATNIEVLVILTHYFHIFHILNYVGTIADIRASMKLQYRCTFKHAFVWRVLNLGYYKLCSLLLGANFGYIHNSLY